VEGFEIADAAFDHEEDRAEVATGKDWASRLLKEKNHATPKPVATGPTGPVCDESCKQRMAEHELNHRAEEVTKAEEKAAAAASDLAASEKQFEETKGTREDKVEEVEALKERATEDKFAYQIMADDEREAALRRILPSQTRRPNKKLPSPQ
jgi:hypothetical protein